MKNKNRPHWILQEIADRQAPRATINLWSQIEARLASGSKESGRKTTARKMKGEFTLKKAFLYTAILLALLTSAAMAFIPNVRAQVIEWISGQTAVFSFGTPSGRITVGLISDGPWGFVPLNPTYLPGGDWVTVPDSYKDEASGLEALKLTINKDEQFVILTQRKALPGESLPNGEAVSVNDQPAVLVTGLSGEAEAGIPLDKNGGVLPEPSGLIQLYPIQYTDGVRLTWQMGEIRLEILSNLPLKQVFKIAASLRPVETGPAQIITAEP
jgi:hypothetical protein